MDNEKNSYSIEEIKNINLDNMTYDEIIQNIKSDFVHDFLKIFSVINIEILNQDLANALINNLTNRPNPIREAVALKIEELYQNEYFINEISKEQLIKAIVDINPNVSRSICNIIQENNELQEYILDDLLKKINLTIQDIKNFEKENKDFFSLKAKNNKSHAKNKLLFSLYWLLEALSLCDVKKYNSEVLKILKFTIHFSDYTIREKTAKILANMNNAPDELIQLVKNDQNFYVKNQVYDKMNNED